MAKVAQIVSRQKRDIGLLPFYKKVLERQENHAIHKVLEIGIGEGDSLMMWRAWFPEAEIYGVDAKQKPIKKLIDDSKIHVMVANQDSIEDMERTKAWVGDNVDLLVDDGSHKPNHQIASHSVLWPNLSPGGIYVIEDIIGNYAKDNETLDYLRDLMGHVSHGYSDIDWIWFCGMPGHPVAAAFIKKKHEDQSHEDQSSKTIETKAMKIKALKS